MFAPTWVVGWESLANSQILIPPDTHRAVLEGASLETLGG